MDFILFIIFGGAVVIVLLVINQNMSGKTSGDHGGFDLESTFGWEERERDDYYRRSMNERHDRLRQQQSGERL